MKLLDTTYGGYMFHCPGCGFTHTVNVEKEGRPRWSFNGNLEQPTFSPSLLVTIQASEGHPGLRCHSFIREGNIEFLTDCTHSLSGQTVPIPEIDEEGNLL